MRTDKQIKEAVRSGQCRPVDAQLEVLLDIRRLLSGVQTEQLIASNWLKTLAERWKKPGRPRKKNGPKPAV